MTFLLLGFLILLLTLFMFTLHVVRSSHGGHHGTSTNNMQGALPIINWFIKMLLRFGIRITILGPMMLLTVNGRKTGKPRTVPVDLYKHEGRRFLIATHGEGNWVHNLRASGKGILSLGRSRQAFRSLELAPEEAGLVIKNVLGPLLASQGMRGSMLQQHLGLTAYSSRRDFSEAALRHPVFELDPPDKISRQN